MNVGPMLLTWEGAIDGVTPTAQDSINQARWCEAVGLPSVWITDHFYFDFADFEEVGLSMPPEMHGVKSGAWECWALLSAIAATTDKITIGSLVTSSSYRNPALLARAADTVDDISDGRLILGIGAGDYPFEHESFGFPFERRISRFEEAIQIVKPLLRGEEVSFAGEFFQTNAAKLTPKSRRENGPPILIGSVLGRPRMTRLTVQYADYWNCFLALTESSLARYQQGWENVQRACDKFGRDPGTLKKNVTINVNLSGGPSPVPGPVPISGSLDEVAEELAAFRAEGIEECSVLLHPQTDAGIENLARAVEKM